MSKSSLNKKVLEARRRDLGNFGGGFLLLGYDFGLYHVVKSDRIKKAMLSVPTEWRDEVERCVIRMSCLNYDWVSERFPSLDKKSFYDWQTTHLEEIQYVALVETIDDFKNILK